MHHAYMRIITSYNNNNSWMDIINNAAWKKLKKGSCLHSFSQFIVVVGLLLMADFSDWSQVYQRKKDGNDGAGCCFKFASFLSSFFKAPNYFST